MSEWLSNLNPEQREAASHDAGPLLILAGAGSGKTTVLVARAGRLIAERVVDAKQLCVLTFTNKAAKELKNRVSAKLGSRAKGLWSGTFHSFGLSLLKKYYKECGLIRDFAVLNPGDGVSLAKEMLKDFKHASKTAYDGDTLLTMVSQWRETGRTEALKDDEYEIAVEWLLPKLLKRYQTLGVVDFDSLILMPIELMEQNSIIKEEIQSTYLYTMVDEFQDTNKTQMRLIRLLTDKHKNIGVVGDDDQSIYGWRGAEVKNILHFPRLYDACKVVRLERNYRSTPQILNLANSVISKNTERHAKVLKPHQGAVEGKLPEVLVCQDENDEVEQVTAEIQDFVKQGHAHRDIAVLYRSNGQGALLEAEMRKQGIQYVMTGGTAFFDRRETRDILAYLRCAVRPNEIAFRRILNVPTRGVGETTVEKLTEIAHSTGKKFVDVCKEWRQHAIDNKPGEGIDELQAFLGGLTQRILSKSAGTYGLTLVQVFQEMGYKAYVEKYSPNLLVASNRWKMVEIFGKILDRYLEQDPSPAGLRDFLDAMELRDALNENKADEDRVQLMTLHACKGLEWPCVIFVGCEEDVIPHKMLGSDIAEERRLFYVGVTRAEKHLVMTRALKRQRHGKIVDSAPSRFLVEIPTHLYQVRQGPRKVDEGRRRAMLDALYAKLENPSA